MAKATPIEKELSKVTKVAWEDGEKRAVYLGRLVEGIQDLEDDAWKKISKDAQAWANTAAKAVVAKKAIKDFELDDAEIEEVEEKPKAKAKAKDEEEEVEEKPKRRAARDEDEERPTRRARKDDTEEEVEEKPKRRARDEEEEVEEKPKRRAARDEEEEEVKPKRKARDEEEEEVKPKRKARDEEEEVEEKPKAKAKDKDKPAKAVVTGPDVGVKANIKRAILKRPNISVDELVEKLGKGGAKVSKVTVANVRAEFRHTIKLLNAEGVTEIAL